MHLVAFGKTSLTDLQFATKLRNGTSHDFERIDSATLLRQQGEVSARQELRSVSMLAADWECAGPVGAIAIDVVG